MKKNIISSAMTLCLFSGIVTVNALYPASAPASVERENEAVPTESDIISGDRSSTIPVMNLETIGYRTDYQYTQTTSSHQTYTFANAVASVNETEESAAKDSEADDEYSNLAIADVNDYVNVRSAPDTDSEILGKLYDGAVAQILDETGEGDNLWFHVISGNVEGYIKAEYFIYGEDAVSVIDDYVTRYARVDADRLNVREKPDIESGRIGYLDNGEKVKIIEAEGDWIRVEYTDSREGYVSSEYVSVWEEFIYAKSIEEEKAEEEAKRLLAMRQQSSESETPENTDYSLANANTDYTTNEELRTSIVDYANQYLGNAYVHGGQSLSGGTDCSGFTCYIYAAFGYSISRTPGGQYSSAGRSITMSEIQPGDIICYSSSGGKCTHVGLYIGDGQIIHSANSRKGVIISNADYDTIIGIKNVID